MGTKSSENVPGPLVRWLGEHEADMHRRLLDDAFAPLRAVYIKTPGPPRSPSRTSRTVVAELEGHIAGAASYYLKGGQVRLFAIAVAPDFRRRGVARALIQWIADATCSETHPDLGLYTIEETGNPRIFEHLGFHRVSRSVAIDAHSPSGGPVHEVDMVRRVWEPS